MYLWEEGCHNKRLTGSNIGWLNEGDLFVCISGS